MAVLMDREAIKQVIPHREPFLLVDEIHELTGETVRGALQLTGEEAWFRGHFPNEPIMPGVLMIEAIAQCGAVLVLSQEQFRGKTAYFAKVDKVRFRRKVVPGDCLELKMDVIKQRGPMGTGYGEARVNGELAVSAELTFVVGEAEAK